MSPWAEVALSKRDRRRGFSRFSSLRLLEIANHESMEQSEDPEPIRVRMFSVCGLIIKAEGE